MDATTLDGLLRRVETLEREKRQVLWICGLLFAGMLLLVGSGMSFSGRKRVVEAESFVVKDSDGNVRARLGVTPDGSPSLALVNVDNKELVSLQSAPDDTASLNFYDRGQTRISMSATSDGGANLGFYDQHSRSMSGFYLWPDSTIGLGMRNGPKGIQLTAQSDGRAGIGIAETNGREIGKIGELAADAMLRAPSPFRATISDEALGSGDRLGRSGDAGGIAPERTARVQAGRGGVDRMNPLRAPERLAP